MIFLLTHCGARLRVPGRPRAHQKALERFIGSLQQESPASPAFLRLAFTKERNLIGSVYPVNLWLEMIFSSSGWTRHVKIHILGERVCSLSSIFGNAVCKVSYQNYTHVLFFNMIRPWIHLTSDFRRVLSSVRFSRKWLGWHKWITHTKLYWFWPTIIQVLMPTLKSLVSHDEFWFVQPVFPEEEIRSLRRSSWPPTAVTNTKDFFSSCLVLIRVKIGMVLWSCRKNSRVQSLWLNWNI